MKSARYNGMPNAPTMGATGPFIPTKSGLQGPSSRGQSPLQCDAESPDEEDGERGAGEVGGRGRGKEAGGLLARGEDVLASA